MRQRWRRLSPGQQGFVWALLLMVAWFAYWFLVNPGDNAEGPTYVDVDSEQTDQAVEGMRPWIVWVGGALVLAAFLGIWSFVHLMRERGVRFEDLDVAEQERREEAGEILHNLGRPTKPDS